MSSQFVIRSEYNPDHKCWDNTLKIIKFRSATPFLHPAQCYEFLVKFPHCMRPSQYHLMQWNKATFMKRARGDGTSHIFSFVLCTVSRVLFETMCQVCLARIVANKMLISLQFLPGIQP